MPRSAPFRLEPLECRLNPAPAVRSVVRAAGRAELSNSPSLLYDVTFSEPVTGVDTGDFALAGTDLSTALVLGVSGAGASYRVAAESRSEGTFRLNVLADGGIASAADGSPLASDFAGGEPTTLDFTPPRFAFAPIELPTNAVRFTSTEPATFISTEPIRAGFTVTRDGGPILPLGGVTLKSLSPTSFEVSGPGLAGVTSVPGKYLFSLSNGAGVDAAGNFGFGAGEIATLEPSPESFAAGGAGAVSVAGELGVRSTLRPFGAAFTGEVRVALADFTGDGTPDVAAAAGPGAAPRVVITDGLTGAVLRDFLAFEATFLGGVNLSAGDLSGDGLPDLVASPDQGGGPRVTVFVNGDPNNVSADFFGIDDANFRGGARTAVGDLNGDGTQDLVVAAGFGGGPRVAAFDGSVLANRAYSTRLFADRFLFEESLRNGAYVAAGDVNGDGFADLLAGGGPGGGPRVRALSGAALTGGGRESLADFFAGDPADRTGVPLAARDVDGDGTRDVVAASENRVRAFTALTGRELPLGGDVLGAYVG